MAEPGNAAEVFRLGRVAEPLPEHRQFAGRLVIPVLKQVGPVQLLFRCIKEECKPNTPEEHHEGHAKVLGGSGERRWMFNSSALMDSTTDEVDICEGEWDAMALVDATGLAAVGIPGSKRWKPSRGAWSGLFGGHRVVRVWAHADEAGQELFEQIKNDIPHARLVHLDEGDVNETLRREGAGALMEAAGL